MKKKLLLIVDNLIPNSPFVLPELPYLSEHFDVSIVSKDKVLDGWEEFVQKYYSHFSVKNFIPKNPKERTIRLWYLLFDKVFWFELADIIRGKRYIPGRISKLIKFHIDAITLKKWISDNYDISEYTVIYSYWYSYSALASVMLKKIFPQLSILTKAHGYDLYKECHLMLFQPSKKYMDENLDRILFISEHGLNYYKKNFALSDARKYELHYLGVKQNLDEIYVRYNKKPALKILSCSYLVQLKRIWLIVDALEKIDDIQIEWTHIGGGSELNNIQKYAGEKLIDKKNIKYFFTGNLENDLVIEYMKSNNFDFLINVSSEEGLPVSMMEAASLGLPIIGTDVGGVSEIVGSDNGILLSNNPSIDEIKNAILVMAYKSEEEMLHLKVNSYKKWYEKFDANKNFSKLALMISSLAKCSE